MTGFAIDRDQIPGAWLLTLRGALKLEARGMKRSGRSALTVARTSAIELTDPETGEVIETIKLTNKRTFKGAYADVNAVIVRLLGAEFDSPLPADFQRLA